MELVIRGQIARPPAAPREWGGEGTAGARRASCVQMCRSWKPAGRSRAPGGSVPRRWARGAACGASTMPLTLGCLLCAQPRLPSRRRPYRAATLRPPPPPPERGAEAARPGRPPRFKAARRASAHSLAAAPRTARGLARSRSELRALRPGRKNTGATVTKLLTERREGRDFMGWLAPRNAAGQGQPSPQAGVWISERMPRL